MTAASSDQSVNSIRDAFQNVVKTTLQDIYQQNTKLQALLRALPTIDVPNLTITVSEPTIHNSGFSYDKKLDWFYLEQSIRIKHIMAGPRQKEYGLKIRLETNGYKMV
ncbi:MAG: hypothetical protein GC136_03915, partial [Alphaproteobacteria bacterium]|nr:hypothetical protein [Alphaproteobacteria bacterium]